MPISNTEFVFIRDLVHRRSAIVLEAGKEYLVEARLEPLARREGFASLRDLVARLRTQSYGALHAEVVEAMTTNETSFFRDRYPFEALRTLLASRLTKERSGQRPLTLWSAACSSGQEPYSLAMLVRDLVPDGRNIRIVASDISRTVLERAREGRYSPLELSRGLPAEYVGRYFRQVGSEWQIHQDIRRMVEFQHINLAESWPSLPAMDVVFLRNVMIYFDLETRKRILGRVARQMREDGVLFLGGAETISQLDEAFSHCPFDRGTYYRRRNGKE